VYPKTRATQLAKQVSRPVLSMPDPQQSDTNLKVTPVKAVSPSGEEIEIAEILAVQPVTPTEATPSSLPQTGSFLLALALASVLALVVAQPLAS